MPMNRYNPEQIVNLQRQIEVAIAYGKTTLQARKEAGITEQTYYRYLSAYPDCAARRQIALKARGKR